MWMPARAPQSGAAAASSQTARTASGARFSPNSAAAASRWMKRQAVSAIERSIGGWAVKCRQEGGLGGGRLRGVRRGARSAGSPGSRVVTSQGRGSRSEGSPRRCGAGYFGLDRCLRGSADVKATSLWSCAPPRHPPGATEWIIIAKAVAVSSVHQSVLGDAFAEVGREESPPRGTASPATAVPPAERDRGGPRNAELPTRAPPAGVCTGRPLIGRIRAQRLRAARLRMPNDRMPRPCVAAYRSSSGPSRSSITAVVGIPCPSTCH